jgi:hypothetical protein
MSTTIFIPSLAIQIDFAYMSPTSIEHTLSPCYHRTHLRLIMDARVVLHVTILAPPFGQTSKGRFQPCIEAHPHSKVFSPWKGNIPKTLGVGQGESCLLL